MVHLPARVASSIEHEVVMRLSLMGFLAAMLCPVQTILQACIADILAVLDRDPACESVVQCMLNFKGISGIAMLPNCPLALATRQKGEH